jgi:hypothetical protein
MASSRLPPPRPPQQPATYAKVVVRGLALAATVLVACTASSQAQSLDQQERCAQQARRAFPEYISGKGIADYQSHYNTKLGKCFMLVETIVSGPNSYMRALLMDAIERREYAYFWDKIPAGGVVVSCFFKNLRGTRYCNSREEFDAFVASYMEQ